MDKKIPIRALATRLAQETQMTVDDAEQFIKTAFELVADELRTGAQVKINALGTFTLTNTSADPVKFQPDAAWSRAVNAAFSMFEPVGLNPGVTEELLNQAAPAQEPPISPISPIGPIPPQSQPQ
ncbi:MAG: HU family DNA-binding protein, partial [Bacteroidales bacterium]|nr:HU family DNA-binding protein [Bacteroidales bacterium]